MAKPRSKPASLDAEAFARQAAPELEQLRVDLADRDSRIRDLDAQLQRLEIANAALTAEVSHLRGLLHGRPHAA